MAESVFMTTDAYIEDVIEAFNAAGECLNLRPDDDSRTVYRFGTPGGAYVTSCWDLKPKIDEYETWVDVYPQMDPEAPVRLFERLVKSLNQPVVLYAPDSDEVVARSVDEGIEWIVPRHAIVEMSVEGQ